MPTSQTRPQDGEDDLVLTDKQVLRRAEDILTAMANAVSAMKIFPSDHATVRNFVDILTGKFDEFFETYQRLEVGVEEYSFTVAGQVVYADELPLKSLPFFFFKDGTQILYFYRGLDREELVEFLELIKTVAQRPGGDNDIVAAMWESELSNIQYFAPDEFLENQILAEKKSQQVDQNLPELPSDLAEETLEVKVDLAKFSQGRIEIKPEDQAKFRWTPGIDAPPPEDGVRPGPQGPQPITSPDQSAGQDRSPAAAADPNFTDAEVHELESMVRANRLLWPEDEFLGLTAEIVYLEDDIKVGGASLDVMAEFVLDQVLQGQFSVGIAALRKIRDLQSHIGSSSPEKSELIDACYKKLTGPRALRAVEGHLAEHAQPEWPALIGFFKELGPMTLPTAAGLYESHTDPEVRAALLAFIQDISGDDPNLIISLANDARPALSMRILTILVGMPEGKGIPSLLAFVMFKNREIKLEVIHQLGEIRSEMANRILMGFLNDPDEELRIQAAMKLDPSEEKSRIEHVIREAASPAFRRKSLKEKQAILSFLGRTRTPDALAFLGAALVRTTLWPSTRNLEMRLAAVQGLESMATPEAKLALESAAHLRGRRVRLAAEEALARIRQAGTQP
jgi:HEAT repeat protein